MKAVTPLQRYNAGGTYQGIPSSDIDKDKEALREPHSVLSAPAMGPDYRQLFKTLGVCLCWLICSSTIILVNKYIMVSIGALPLDRLDRQLQGGNSRNLSSSSAKQAAPLAATQHGFIRARVSC